jgi:hypothetical protein
MRPVEKFVALVICCLFVVPPSASATSDARTLLRSASHLSGLTARRPVPTTTLSGARYDALLGRAYTRDYPRSLQQIDARLYARLGLMTRSIRAGRPTSLAWYDPTARKLLLRRNPIPEQKRVVYELVRALIDQNFGLGRLAGLRSRDRDKALAARAIVDGAAARAAGIAAGTLHGTPLERFLQLEDSAGAGPGRALAAELQYLGGKSALASALRTFPQTTEQVLHIDKFLERERALPLRVPANVGDAKLVASQTFGELELRNLLRAFAVPNAAAVAAGWGGGRLALYATARGEAVAALTLRWDTHDDAAEWRDSVPRYVAAAFPDAARSDCPPLDSCWSSPAEAAAGTLDESSVLVLGPGAQGVAAALLGPN